MLGMVFFITVVGTMFGLVCALVGPYGNEVRSFFFGFAFVAVIAITTLIK